MEETLVPIVTDRIGSISLNDLILSIAKNQMTSWKPDIGIMQQFQEYDNEGYNIYRCLFDVVQNSKLRFITCSEVFLFGLNSQNRVVLQTGQEGPLTITLLPVNLQLLRNFN